MYRYGLIGNCQASALVHDTGSIDWFCAPRPDSPPIFGKLLDPQGGEFSILPAGEATFTQRYLPNTNVLITYVTTAEGAYTITDFCPRFEQYGRMYRPIALFRLVEPTEGNPILRVRCKPVDGWTKQPVVPVRGNSHLRYEMRGDCLRLLTTMSLTHLSEETAFPLTEPIYFGLTWSASIEDDLVKVTKDFLSHTIQYWRTWVKHCSIPSLFQKETIRSALALKLHCFEDTGAILAAMTTSLPEEIGKNRNWDYRLCWLRDTYFTLSAFNRLGHFEEMEGFLNFLLSIVYSHDSLKPVYRVDGTLPLPEIEHENWQGFSNSHPVRSNNEAATHVQNDVYGEMVLSFAPIFFDERFQHLRTREHEKLVEHLAERCASNISLPDAGLWELRGGWQEHTFTNLMCWAGLNRVAVLQEKGYFRSLSLDVRKALKNAEEAMLRAVRDGSLRNGPQDESFNAALLQTPILGFRDKALCEKTVAATHDALRFSPTEEGKCFLYRYNRNDDFGAPQSAFLFCSFWWIQALARLGHLKEGTKALERVLAAANPLGLLAEHYLPSEGVQLGNFPQAYSHVGEINAAFAVSPSWEDIL